MGSEAIERLRFLASFRLAGTGQREGGEKTQPFNHFQSRLGTLFPKRVLNLHQEDMNLFLESVHFSVCSLREKVHPLPSHFAGRGYMFPEAKMYTPCLRCSKETVFDSPRESELLPGKWILL